MSIEFKCSGCGNTLRVPDEHAGRQAKCPVCETLSTVPESAAPVDEPTFGQPGEQPSVQPPETAPTQNVGDSPFHQSGAPGEPIEGGGATQNPYAAPTQDPNASPLQTAQNRRSHRGGTILALGILSLLCCGLLGIPAWMMANEDLAQMDRGVMDTSGRGLTMAGKVLGIIALVIMALGVLLQFSATIINA